MAAPDNTSRSSRRSTPDERRRTGARNRSSSQQFPNRRKGSGRQDRQDFRGGAPKSTAPREKHYEIPNNFKMFQRLEPRPQSFEVLASWRQEETASGLSYRTAREQFIYQCRDLGANGAVNVRFEEVIDQRIVTYVTGTPVIFGIVSSRGEYTADSLLDYYLPNRLKTAEDVDAYRQKMLAKEVERLEEEKSKISRTTQWVIVYFLILTLLLIMAKSS